MNVVGIYLVRNEVDVMETNLRHHLATVLDEAIVLDNGSTDGTLELVGELAEELPIALSSEVGEMYQADRTTRLARFAWQRGADWVLPIDADEFWVARAGVSFRAVLADAPADARALVVELVNFVQRRDVLVGRPHGLATMTMRAADLAGPAEDGPRLMREEGRSWLELAYAPKLVHRAAPDLLVPKGNHLLGVAGECPTDRLVCLHAPVRARAVLAAKADHGRRMIEEGGPAQSAWHTKRWWAMVRAGSLERAWPALSFEDGALCVEGTPHPLVRDDRLREAVEAVAPRVRTTAARAAQPTDEMALSVAAFYMGLDDVSGALSRVDLRLLVALDRVQREHGVTGDLVVLGAGCARRAILLGYLARPPAERVLVCDAFDHTGRDAPTRREAERAFTAQYARFHDQLPDVVVRRPEQFDAGAASLTGTGRIVLVDSGLGLDHARSGLAAARLLAGPGGLVVVGAAGSGEAAAAPEAVAASLPDGDVVRPLCLTEENLYCACGGGAMDWDVHLAALVAREADLALDRRAVAGRAVGRLVARGRAPVPRDHVVRIPDLEALVPAP